jgi:two-component system chemotaxis sensor kinase CheA
MIVLKPAGGDAYALAVDLVHDHEELVIKPAAPAVMAAGLYAGTTLSDEGSPVLLLDPSGIALSASLPSRSKDIEKLGAEQVAEEVERPGVQALLFRTRGGIKRAISLAVVDRIQDMPADAVRLTAGRLRIALDDKILPLGGCGDAECEGPLRILRLSDGNSELAYGFGEVVDLVTLQGEMKPAAVPGEIGGVTLIADEQVEVIDPYWLFASICGEAGLPRSRPVCALPADDPWMHNILRPIIESAGYRVVTQGEVAAPDILIASAEAALEESGAPAEVIRIRAHPDLASERDDSIYRYDRAALLSALGRSAARKG